MSTNRWAVRDIVFQAISVALMAQQEAAESDKSHFVVRVTDDMCYICNMFGIVTGPLDHLVAQSVLENNYGQ